MTQASYTILLVDDQPEVLRTLRAAIKDRARRVLSTSDPNEALRIVEEEFVDVLLCDVEMPGMTGTELCARVRERHPDVVRMILTGNDSLSAAIRAINEGGVFRYLTKPWRLEDLNDAVAASLAQVDTLRRNAEDRLLSAARDQILSELERAYPGVTTGLRRGARHEIDGARIESVARALERGGIEHLLSDTIRAVRR